MAEYLIQEETLVGLADEIRELSGTTGKLGLDAMTTNVGAANDTVDSQASIISQIANALEGKAGGAFDTVRYVEQTLTEEQKAQARENISAASGDWFLIADVTTTEDIQTFSITEDMDGKPFECSKVMIYMYVPEGQQATGIAISARGDTIWGNSNLLLNSSANIKCRMACIESSNDNMAYIFHYKEMYTNSYFLDDGREGFMIRRGDEQSGKPITQVRLEATSADRAFIAGTQLFIWGCKV